MEKLISVIIPAYNAESTIDRCVKSISSKDVEIIVVIDGATDNTLKVCEKLKKNNTNLIIIEQSNKGAYEARKNGIKNAQGKYIMFLDADDCYYENTINRMGELIEKYNEPDIICFRYKKIPNEYILEKYIEEDENIIFKKDFKKVVYPKFIEGYSLNAVWDKCYKREKLQFINIPQKGISFGEDLLLNLEFFSNIDNVVFTNDILYKYIYKENSITNSRNINRLLKNLEDAIEIYSTIYNYLEKWGICNINNVNLISNKIKKETKTLIERIKNST